jgi:hypothetical protein
MHGRIVTKIYSIATYLNQSSQARAITEAGRGVAWKSWESPGVIE